MSRLGYKGGNESASQSNSYSSSEETDSCRDESDSSSQGGDDPTFSSAGSRQKYVDTEDSFSSSSSSSSSNPSSYSDNEKSRSHSSEARSYHYGDDERCISRDNHSAASSRSGDESGRSQDDCAIASASAASSHSPSEHSENRGDRSYSSRSSYNSRSCDSRSRGSQSRTSYHSRSSRDDSEWSDSQGDESFHEENRNNYGNSQGSDFSSGVQESFASLYSSVNDTVDDAVIREMIQEFVRKAIPHELKNLDLLLEKYKGSEEKLLDLLYEEAEQFYKEYGDTEGSDGRSVTSTGSGDSDIRSDAPSRYKRDSDLRGDNSRSSSHSERSSWESRSTRSGYSERSGSSSRGSRSERSDRSELSGKHSRADGSLTSDHSGCTERSDRSKQSCNSGHSSTSEGGYASENHRSCRDPSSRSGSSRGGFLRVESQTSPVANPGPSTQRSSSSVARDVRFSQSNGESSSSYTSTRSRSSRRRRGSPRYKRGSRRSYRANPEETAQISHQITNINAVNEVTRQESGNKVSSESPFHKNESPQSGSGSDSSHEYPSCGYSQPTKTPSFGSGQGSRETSFDYSYVQDQPVQLPGDLDIPGPANWNHHNPMPTSSDAHAIATAMLAASHGMHQNEPTQWRTHAVDEHHGQDHEIYSYEDDLNHDEHSSSSVDEDAEYRRQSYEGDDSDECDSCPSIHENYSDDDNIVCNAIRYLEEGASYGEESSLETDSYPSIVGDTDDNRLTEIEVHNHYLDQAPPEAENSFNSGVYSEPEPETNQHLHMSLSSGEVYLEDGYDSREANVPYRPPTPPRSHRSPRQSPQRNPQHSPLRSPQHIPQRNPRRLSEFSIVPPSPKTASSESQHFGASYAESGFFGDEKKSEYSTDLESQNPTRARRHASGFSDSDRGTICTSETSRLRRNRKRKLLSDPGVRKRCLWIVLVTILVLILLIIILAVRRARGGSNDATNVDATTDLKPKTEAPSTLSSGPFDLGGGIFQNGDKKVETTSGQIPGISRSDEKCVHYIEGAQDFTNACFTTFHDNDGMAQECSVQFDLGDCSSCRICASPEGKVGFKLDCRNFDSKKLVRNCTPLSGTTIQNVLVGGDFDGINFWPDESHSREPLPVAEPTPTSETSDTRPTTSAPAPVTTNAPPPPPTSSAPPPEAASPQFKCFASRRELETAVDQFMIGTDLAALSEQYGESIGEWCVSGVSDMSNLFSRSRNSLASSFDKDISGWDVSGVTNMSSMFYGASSFSGDLSNWEVSSVTDMSHMFSRTDAFDADISSWNVAQVTSMESMFSAASAFNHDLSQWRLDSIQTIESMFAGARSFQQNLCSWGEQLQGRTTVVASDVFSLSRCPAALIPVDLNASPAGPFCTFCDVNGGGKSPSDALHDLLCPLLQETPCTALLDEKTPQGKAFSWVLSNTGIWMNNKKIQRFALATLYYSTNGESWTDSAFWMTNVDECLWQNTASTACNSDKVMVGLGLDNNNLSGSLLPEIGLLTTLKELRLQNPVVNGVVVAASKLTGSLPASIGSKLKNLDSLRIMGHALTGGIPSSYGNLLRLKTLDLSYNGLTGAIPSEVGNLPAVEKLFLNSNSLGQTVPESLSNLSSLAWIRLDENDLTGAIPESVCTAWTGKVNAYVDCAELTGEAFPCANFCCSDSTGCACRYKQTNPSLCLV